MKQIIKRWDNQEIIYQTDADTLREAVEEAVAREISLYNADFERAYLECVNLERAYLECAKFKGANLHSAYLRFTYLEGANFEGANLEYINLRGAYLEGANFEGANLQIANLRGAYLDNANFKGANVQGTIIVQLTIPDLYQINGIKEGCQIGCQWKTWGDWDDIIENKKYGYYKDKCFKSLVVLERQVKAYKLAKKMIGVK